MTEQHVEQRRIGVLERKPKAVLAAAAIILLMTLGIGAGVIPSLSGGGFDANGTESANTTLALQREFKVGDADAVLLATARRGTIDSPRAAAEGIALAGQVRAEPGVESVISYWASPSTGGLRGNDGKQALLLIQLSGSQNDKSSWLSAAHKQYDERPGALRIQIGGNAEVFRAIQDQIISDLIIAEAVAVALGLVLLLFVFRSMMSALLPIAMGALSAGITVFVLRVLSEFTEVSIFSLNLTSALTLGLGIDYGLLMVTRFREELAAGRSAPTAVARTLRTAGRTVVFSGMIVGLSLATLLLFPLPFLRSFAYAAIPSVFGAVLGAIIVLPAMLRLLGHNIEKWPLTRLPTINPSEASWCRIARWSIRWRFPVSGLLIIGLALLAVPFLHVKIGKSDEKVLPASAQVRDVQQEIRDNFPGNAAFPVNVYLPDLGDSPAGRQRQADVAAEITTLPHVSLARGAGGIWQNGLLTVPLARADAATSNGTGSFLSVLLKPDVDVYSTQAEQTVDAIRAISYDGQRPQVTGESARLVDDKRVIGDRLPLAIGLIVVFTFILTFMLCGSVVVPLKALFLNLLSLTATFGVMVWGFQDGNLAGLLGFTSSGYLDNAMPVLMFCAAFGLSMDYELFLVSRIREEYLHSKDNDAAVVEGIAKTGAVFTSAALLLAVVFAGLIASKVSIIKMAGAGIVLAILMDAIVIRSVLVPALMSMMGKANWWAPRFLRTLHSRIALSEIDTHSDDEASRGAATSTAGVTVS